MPPKRRKLLGRRTAAASAARAARASETPEQTSLCLSRKASSSAARLSTESAAAQTERLASVASTMFTRRARLSVECSLQNSQDAFCVARLRASHSPAQKTHRRLQDTTAKACSRASPRALESPAQTTVRRVRKTRSTASARALESPAQTTVRRVRNARSTASARAIESPAQTTVRRIRNAHSTAFARAAENSEASCDSMSTSKTVFCRTYYAYMFMIREGEFNHLNRCRQIFLQFAVDMGAKIESERLGFIKLNQSKLRTDSYIHLRDGLRSDGDPRNLGKPCILPSSYTGGPRYMHERTQDAMTYVRHYGRPDLFVTFTCNPKWVEITRELFQGEKYSHRPDLIARVFRLQLCKVMDLILKGQVFGRGKYHMYTVEWQKRGLPHAHILLWLNDKVDANKIDDFISAEIPDPVLDPLLHEIIKNNMIHGPCGANYEKRSCWSSGPTCAKGHPRKFISETQTATDGYPLYRRRSPAEVDRTNFSFFLSFNSFHCFSVSNSFFFILTFHKLLSCVFSFFYFSTSFLSILIFSSFFNSFSLKFFSFLFLFIMSFSFILFFFNPSLHLFPLFFLFFLSLDILLLFFFTFFFLSSFLSSFLCFFFPFA
ncbi:unnamed protein product [Acanthosepion pharaonis]|uniref:Helitron helicase-like domain-containing protein n=1 Tax=Acanthosepion pharaonis TaxID=158019 RepID=A0A812BV29_ACAPH|nr:unnamed protein product [Sepia pharaonis]